MSTCWLRPAGCGPRLANLRRRRPSVLELDDPEVVEADPVLLVRWTVVALDADAVVAGRGKARRGCRLILTLRVGPELGRELLSRHDDPELDLLARHGLSPRDDAELPFDELLDDLEDGLL